MTKTTSKFIQLRRLPDEQFKRMTGVQRSTFTMMVDILVRADTDKKLRGGRANKLRIEDRLLMALEYLREYRTYFHIAQSYGLSESTAYKTCRWVEDTLIKDKRFALPGKKTLQNSDISFEVVLVDASESPIERPKKDNGATTPAKRNGIPSKAKSSSTKRRAR